MFSKTLKFLYDVNTVYSIRSMIILYKHSIKRVPTLPTFVDGANKHGSLGVGSIPFLTTHHLPTPTHPKKR